MRDLMPAFLERQAFGVPEGSTEAVKRLTDDLKIGDDWDHPSTGMVSTTTLAVPFS
jgi:hypothetical protein